MRPLDIRWLGGEIAGERASERRKCKSSFLNYCMDDRRPVQSLDSGRRRPMKDERCGSSWADGVLVRVETFGD